MSNLRQCDICGKPYLYEQGHNCRPLEVSIFRSEEEVKKQPSKAVFVDPGIKRTES